MPPSKPLRFTYRGPLARPGLSRSAACSRLLSCATSFSAGLIEAARRQAPGPRDLRGLGDFLKHLGLARIEDLPDYDALHARYRFGTHRRAFASDSSSISRLRNLAVIQLLTSSLPASRLRRPGEALPGRLPTAVAVVDGRASWRARTRARQAVVRINAPSAFVADVATGRVLYAAIRRVLPIASLGKPRPPWSSSRS